MKNKKALIAIPVLLVVLVAVYGAIMMSGRSITAAADDLNGRFVQVVENNGCLQCHMAEPDPFWYQEMPVVSGLFEKDMTNAYRSLDLEAVIQQLNSGEEVSIADVAKLEQSTINNSMPIVEYTMVHWGADLNAEEQQIIRDWVKVQRTAHVQAMAERFGMELDEAELAKAVSEPIQILPDPAGQNVDMAKAELGLALYHDTRLSADGTISCASCHALDNAGQDNSKSSRGIGSQMGGVSAPTVYNAVFNIRQFWNGRAADLQEQAGGPPLNPIEMGHTSFDDIAALLEQDPEMVAAFEKAYGAEGINQNTITDAIATFEQLLITTDSPFDLYLGGDSSALTAEEIQGYEEFKKNYCATCHVGPSMGGQSFERLGTVESADNYFAERGTEINGDDQGLYGFTGDEDDLYKYKVPTLRNIALTAPYFHDGRYLTLEEAVRTMFRFNTDNPNPSDSQVDSVVAFLNTLTGENEYMDYANVPNNTLLD